MRVASLDHLIAMKEAAGLTRDKLTATEYGVLADELRAPRNGWAPPYSDCGREGRNSHSNSVLILLRDAFGLRAEPLGYSIATHYMGTSEWRDLGWKVRPKNDDRLDVDDPAQLALQAPLDGSGRGAQAPR